MAEPPAKKKNHRRGSPSGAGTLDTRDRLLQAAKSEFAKKGLHAASVDKVADRAKANKQLIYYYFGSKDALYLAVLEHTYADIRVREQELQLKSQDPIQAMTTLVGFSFDYVVENPEFVQLLTNENVMEARYLRRSNALRLMRSPLVALIEDTLQRGVELGLFRDGVNAVQLYISIAALCFFYSANVHTLTVLFDRDLNDPAALSERRSHVIDFVLNSLRAQNEDMGSAGQPQPAGRSTETAQEDQGNRTGD